ncbi:RNA polymerase recycling motor HelD [Alkalihalobacillus hemicellulosilyticus]|uniref:DNA 3'-5' helicase n=1 Tax=Halalkalibacter hemicellulosilyticusJCM 9152 TaxID=1236971 RepID=W4QFB8_9BACI|nr:RNA polymerase recycling motor HelD [Halalkalibacter hemicellulosilyticus]GAE30622.1 ATP-dependent DNA helicase rep [Halalkalibacter hemicellulosilyticusJCM 9152]
MNISRTDILYEQKRVNEVVAYIEQYMNQLEAQITARGTDVTFIKKNFWEDVTVNLDNDEEAVETFSSIKQQAELLSERERSQMHDTYQLKKLERLKDSPYFGRINFVEKGESDVEQIYIGIASLTNEEGYDFYIYDWRAPIASMYYDFGPGEAFYETPLEKVTGEILLKKQMLIRQGTVRHVFETGMTIGDDVLQEVLGSQSSAQMKSIVSTIQQEQNQIIRNERSKILIVNGVAGSGKTSVAMQRVAYLLYRYREQISAEQIILFSPNALFNQYVAEVLPELGEDNMQQTTFQAYLHHRLGKRWKIEDPYDQLEYVLTKKDENDYLQRLESIDMKSSYTFMKEMDRFIDTLRSVGLPFHHVYFHGEVLFQSKWISEHFDKTDSSLSIPNRIEQLIETLLKHIDIFEKEERKQNWVLDEIEQLSDSVIQTVYERIERESDGYVDSVREESLLRALIVKRKLKPIRASIRQFSFIDFPLLYEQFLQSLNPKSFPHQLYFNEMIETTVSQLKKRKLYYEDMTPFLYLRSMIEGFEVNMAMRHVFVDEAQDYSPFQFAYLMKLFPKARFTILGDLHQSIYAHSYRMDSFQLFHETSFSEKVESYSLTKSYRSTRQIIDLASEIIDSGIIPFNRSGAKPMLIQVKNEEERRQRIVQEVNRLQREHEGKVAIICKSDEQTYLAYHQLSNDLNMTYVKKDTSEIQSSIQVIPAYLAKGMEYDCVIIYDASIHSYSEEKERNLLYTACTRAMHSLTLCYDDMLSPLLPKNKELYT